MPVNPYIRWDDFSDILENTEENFTYEIYRPSSRIEEETGSAFEVLQNTSFGYDAMWIYPEERKQHTVSGSIYSVEVIFLFKPTVDVRHLDFILRLDRDNKFYRVLSIDDFKSHLEVGCYCPQMQETVLEKFLLNKALLSTTGMII